MVFDVIGLWTKRRGLAHAAYYNLLAAALLLHVVLACVSSVMIWLVWWVHCRTCRQTVYLPNYRFILELAAVSIVALTGIWEAS